MRFADANQLDRKSGVRLGRTWATRPGNQAYVTTEIFATNRCGIPHLAKNERDMGHPASS
jgi:hypothetical protein